MSFQKYKVKDNAFSTLLTWITASATSLQTQAGAWDKFPANNFIATLVQYETPWDETSEVVKREKVLVSNNATDTFTITRWFDWDTPVSFEAWDFVYLNVVSKIIEDIQDEATRLENDKLNKSWALRTWLTNWRLLLINWSWVETELALWTAGQVLISQWTTSNPVWQAPTVDIAWLTATTTPIWTDTAVINTGAGNRKTTLLNLTKWLQEATETLKGTVERARDAEATAGTETTRYITPKQAKDNYTIKTKVMNFSRSTTTAEWTVTYSHNLWRIPKTIEIRAYIAWDKYSIWNYDGSNQYCIRKQLNSITLRTTEIINVWWSTSSSSEITGIINNVTETNFDITWTGFYNSATIQCLVSLIA